jgi:putative membrane protein
VIASREVARSVDGAALAYPEGSVARTILQFAVVVGTFLILTRVVPGFYLRDWGAAVVAALLFGLVNATLGIILRILTFPLILLTFGLFSFVVNALLLMFVAFLVPGFSINGFFPALLAALVLAGVNMLFKSATARRREEP